MNEHDELTTRLSAALTDRADAMSGTSFGMDVVQGRARSIRRRRTATAVAGAAAAVAILVPTVALASHDRGRDEPAPAVTNTPTPTPTTTTTEDAGHQPPAGVLDVSDLPTGAAPGLEYVTGGRTLHLTDGGTVELPTRYPVSSFVALGDGSHVWLTTHAGTPYVEVEDGDGGLQDPVPSGWALSVNDAGTLAAWVRPDGQVMTWGAGATTPLAYGDPVPAGDDLRIGPVLGDSCGPKGFCQVYVNVPDQQGRDGWQPWLVDANGTQKYDDGTYSILWDSTESGLSVGYRTITDAGSCSVLLGGGEFAGFKTCRNTLVSFSPDDQLVLGDPSYHDGIGNGVIAMYDLEGHRLFQRSSTQQAQAFYTSAEWEDDTHVLSTVFQDGRWAIVRTGSDGSMQDAVTPVEGGMERDPFVLETTS